MVATGLATEVQRPRSAERARPLRSSRTPSGVVARARGERRRPAEVVALSPERQSPTSRSRGRASSSARRRGILRRAA